MFCSIKSPPQRKFVWRFSVAMVIYPAFAILAVLGFVRLHAAGVASYLLAALPALPIAAALAATGAYLAEEKDEFLRNLQVQSLLGGIGGTLVLITVWGVLENFAHVRRMDLLWIWPIFWVLTGISFAAVMGRYR